MQLASTFNRSVFSGDGAGSLSRDTKRLAQVTEMFTVVIMVMVSRVYTNGETYQIVYFQYVQFTVCQFHLTEAVRKGE